MILYVSIGPIDKSVKSPLFQGGVTGSNPVGTTNIKKEQSKIPGCVRSMLWLPWSIAA